MCGCSKNTPVNRQQAVRANLQARRVATPVPPQLNRKTAATPAKPLTPNDKRRIQRLHQESIRKSLNL